MLKLTGEVWAVDVDIRINIIRTLYKAAVQYEAKFLDCGINIACKKGSGFFNDEKDSPSVGE